MIHCPRCGQEQASEQTRFCSRCGFLLTGVAELLANGGEIPVGLTNLNAITPRKKGLKKGLFIFLLAFLVVPIIAILTIMVGAEPFAVAISAIILTVGGLLRMAYALMFESNDSGEAAPELNVLTARQKFLKKESKTNSLPPAHSIPANSYVPPAAGNWRDTNDLTASSVTESTTKLLEREK